MVAFWIWTLEWEEESEESLKDKGAIYIHLTGACLLSCLWQSFDKEDILSKPSSSLAHVSKMQKILLCLIKIGN